MTIKILVATLITTLSLSTTVIAGSHTESTTPEKMTETMKPVDKSIIDDKEKQMEIMEDTMMEPQNFVVNMLNRNPENPRENMVFSQPIIFANPGDTITFIPTDRGHSSESIKDFIPEGAEPWKSSINEEITITLTQEGVYGYKCTPHASMGMFGLIIVGNPDIIEIPENVRIRGKRAQERMNSYIEDANAIYNESMSHE